MCSSHYKKFVVSYVSKVKVNVLCERSAVLQNVQGFRKVDAEKWEFASEGFLRGQRHLLKTIRRRKTPPHPQASNQGSDPCVEVGGFGLDAEIDRLRRDKQVLTAELVKLRQQQQNTKAFLKAMEQRLQVTEMKQQQMMTFMAKAIQNPSLLEQLVQQKERRKALAEAISNKRRRPIDQGPSYGFGVGELGQGMHLVEDYVGKEAKPQDEGFWDGLIHEDTEDQIGYFGVEGEGVEDLDILTEQLGFLGSNPP